MDQQGECVVQVLAEDMLADVLRRLPPRSLAMSRCVCKQWRTQDFNLGYAQAPIAVVNKEPRGGRSLAS